MKVYGKESKKWEKRMRESIKEYDQQRKTRTLTDKQKASIPKAGFDSLKKVVRNMKRELSHVLKKDINNWRLRDLLRVQDLLILALYSDKPLRLDYATLRIDPSPKYNIITKQTVKPRGWYITLRDFKTAASMGEQKIKLSVANGRLLNKFVPASRLLTNHKYLLTNKMKRQMTKQVLSKTLQRLTREKFGKSFSTQILRVMFAMKHRDVIEKAKQISKDLLHSQEQNLEYAKKD